MNPYIIAHRGVRNIFPENTRMSIEAALRLPIDGVEFDIELSSDLIPVVVHQESMTPEWGTSQLIVADSAPNRNWCAEFTADQITMLDAGVWFDAQFKGEKIVRLDALETLPWSGKIVFAELKSPLFWNGRSRQADAERIVEASLPHLRKLSEQGADMWVLSFDPEVLKALKSLAVDIQSVLAIWTTEEGEGIRVTESALRDGCKAITMPDTMLIKDESWLRYTEKNGLKLITYEVSTSERSGLRFPSAERFQIWNRLRELQVFAITTDFPEDLKGYYQRHVA